MPRLTGKGPVPTGEQRPGSSTAKRASKATKDRSKASKLIDEIPPPFECSDEDLERVLRTELPEYDPWDLSEGYHLDHDLARKAISFFHQELRHSRGKDARKPFILGDWEKAIVGNLFGWVDESGARRFREALVYVPRKNGKTPIAAGCIMYGLLEDGEPSAECFGCASTFEQACLIHQQCDGYIEFNPRLAARVQVYKAPKSVHLVDHPANVDRFGFYRPLSADGRIGHGLTPSMCVVDELHLQPDRELVDAMLTSMASEGRRQPLVIHITTADYARPSICNEKLDYAKKVRTSVIRDARFLPAIWEAGVEEDWTDPKVWARVNPNLGVSVSEDYLKRECQRAKDEPAFSETFKRLHLNIQTLQLRAWLDLHKFDACDGAVEGLEGQKCYAGLDLASSRDTTSLVLVFPKEDGSIDVLPYFWLPKADARKREKRDRVPYSDFAIRGELFFAGDDQTDYSAVSAFIAKMYQKYKIVELAYDRYNAPSVLDALRGLGLRNLIEYNQGYVGMNAPAKEFERLISAGKVRHGGHGLYRYQAACVAIKEQPGTGYIMPHKDTSTDRIDGIVATLMALGRAMVAPKRRKMENIEWI